MPNPTQTPKQIIEQMRLEARRNFLMDHIKKFSQDDLNILNYLSLSNPQFDSSASLESQISQLEKHLQKFLESYKKKLSTINDLALKEKINAISLVLLKNIGDENAGISKNIGKHFEQLNLQNKKPPFVELQKVEGLKFYWDSKNAQQQFANLLTSCGIDITQQENDDTPSITEYSKSHYTVSVSHLEVEKLLLLAQYHPYSVHHAITDLYQAKGFNRAECLVKAARQKTNNQTVKSLQDTIAIIDTQRTSINSQQDIVTVSLAAVIPPKKEPHHVVILLDDSGSMSGSKMKTANIAVTNFIKNLPDETLITLQPLNNSTQAIRKSAKEIRDYFAKNPVKNTYYSDHEMYYIVWENGDTPLLENLAASAVFLRESPNQYTISEQALNNTTIVMVTDGQPNQGTAPDAIYLMQTSQGVGAKYLDNLQVPSLDKDTFVSFGYGGISCHQLPVVFSVAVGADSDQKFIEELSLQLNSPHAFVRTDDNMEKDINNAFNLLTQVQGRIPFVFIGLSYDNPTTGQREIVAQESYNLIMGRTREIDFCIPNSATNVEICLIANHSIGFSTVNSSATSQNEQLTIDRFIQSSFAAIRTDFSKRLTALQTTWKNARENSISVEPHDNSGGRFRTSLMRGQNSTSTTSSSSRIFGSAASRNSFNVRSNSTLYNANNSRFTNASPTSSRQRGQHTSCTQPSIRGARGEAVTHNTTTENLALNQLKKQFEHLKKETEKKLNQLLTTSPDNLDNFRKDIQLFISAINNTTLDYPISYSQQTMSRQDIACFTQQRVVGQPATMGNSHTISNSTLHKPQDAEIFSLIKTSNFVTALEKINLNLSTVMLQKQQTGYEATPLIYAITLFNTEEFKNNSTKKESLRNFILKILSLDKLVFSTLVQDATGNTALHRAAWYGEFAISKKIIELAKKNNEFEQLKNLRNNNMISATTQAETAIECIRASENTKFTIEQKTQLYQLITEPTHTAIFQQIQEGKVDDIKETIKKYPQELNRHITDDIANGASPLLAMLYQIVKGKFSLEIKRKLQNLVIELLEQHKETIDLTESDYNGNTLLHYSFYYGPMEIADKLVDIAIEKGQLVNLLKARNNTGALGETPLMNLVQNYEEDLGTKNSALENQAQQKRTETMLKIQSIWKIHFTQIVNTEQLERAPEYLFLEKISDENLKNIFSRDELNQIDSCLKKFREIEHRNSLYEKILPYLSTLQVAEVAHLKTLQKKASEGYSSYYWLKAAPIPKLNRLIQKCKDYCASKEDKLKAESKWRMGYQSNLMNQEEDQAKSEAVRNLQAELTQLQQGNQTVQNILDYITRLLGENNPSILKMSSTIPLAKEIDSPVKNLYLEVQQSLTNFKCYIEKEKSAEVVSSQQHQQKEYVLRKN